MSSDIWYSSLCGSELEGEEADTERRAFRSWGLNSFFWVREQVRSKPRYLPYFFSIGAKASGAYWTTTKRFPVNRHKGVAVFSRLLWRYCNSNFLQQIIDLKKAIQKQQEHGFFVGCMAMQGIQIVVQELQNHLLTIDLLRIQAVKLSNRTKVADLDQILLVHVSWCDLALTFRHLSLYLGKKRCKWWTQRFRRS